MALRINRYLTFRISTNKPLPIFDRRGRERGTAANDRRLLDGAPGQDALSYYHDLKLDQGVAEGDIDDAALLADLEVRAVTEERWLRAKAKDGARRRDDRQDHRRQWKAVREKLGLTPRELRILAIMMRELA